MEGQPETQEVLWPEVAEMLWQGTFEYIQRGWRLPLAVMAVGAVAKSTDPFGVWSPMLVRSMFVRIVDCQVYINPFLRLILGPKMLSGRQIRSQLTVYAFSAGAVGRAKAFSDGCRQRMTRRMSC